MRLLIGNDLADYSLTADARRHDAREGKTIRNCPSSQLKENLVMAKKAKAANERLKVKNLMPQKEQKLSTGEQKKVKGGGSNYYTNDWSLTVVGNQSETASAKKDGGRRQ